MRSDDSGNILLLTAFSMVALLGMAALALDVSYAYDVRNRLAMSADAAAKSAAIEIWRGNAANYTAFAQGVIAQDKGAGRIPTTTGAIIRLCSDAGATCLPSYATNRYVEVILDNTQATYLGGIVGVASLTPRARAVAGTTVSDNCILTLTGGMIQTNPATGAVVTATNCSAAIAGDFEVYGTLNADSISAGSCSEGCDGVSYPAPPPSDPLSLLTTPTNADCNSGLPGWDITVSTAMALPPGTYHNITYTSGALLSFANGIYCLTGVLKPQNPGVDLALHTSEALIYVTPTGEFRAASNNIDLAFSAMTTGSWKGVSFFQDRTNTNDVTFGKNNGLIDTNGAIYVPAAKVVAKNANFASSRACGILVAGSIEWDKPNLTFDATCNDFGGSPLTSVSLAE